MISEGLFNNFSFTITGINNLLKYIQILIVIVFHSITVLLFVVYYEQTWFNNEQ